MLKSTQALKKSDDLFEKSSMSFGEHLEELRQTLIKASFWLIGGLLVGIPSATTVVAYFQRPLELALNDFYRDESIHAMEKGTGTTITSNLKTWMVDNKHQTEVIYIDREMVQYLANGTMPAPSAASTSAEPTEEANSLEEKGATPSLATDRMPSPDVLTPIRTFREIKSQAETFQMEEGMMIWFKAALVVAFLVASPGIFYHIWGFVAAGLYPHERRYVYFFLPSAVGLFWLGALFAFFVVFRFVISFLLNFNSMMGVGTTPRLEAYMSFALMLPLAFGISFQLPLVMLIVERLGIVTIKQYLAQWRMAIFVIAVASMVLTPSPDATTMLAMALPLIFLYFLGIGLCQFLPRPNLLAGGASDPR